MKSTYVFKSKVWLYPGSLASGGRWHFISLPKKASEEIKKNFSKSARGWGSLKIKARIEKTNWSSSIFPDGKSGTYLLPLKASVRKNEGIFDGDTISISIVILK